jgi:hypothetical protein
LLLVPDSGLPGLFTPPGCIFFIEPPSIEPLGF